MIHVVCAVILNEGKILIAQRSKKMSLALKWEFPGGKVENGEDKNKALKREINEELNMEISIIKELTAVVHRYPDFELCLYPFLCLSNSRRHKAIEHVQILWENVENLKNYEWAAADVPVVDEVISLFDTGKNSCYNF